MLDLSWNQLSGKIPRLANLKMRHLDLEGNKLSGKIPKDLGQLPQLLHLTLGWFGEYFLISSQLSRMGLSYSQIKS